MSNNIVKIANALSVTATGIGAAVRLGKTPLLGGHGREGILMLDAAVGGSGVVAIQGHPSREAKEPTEGDSGWATLVTLNASSARVQEIKDLPGWIRPNVTTTGTGTVTVSLQGVQ
ncbi:MAG: hypothetical protein IAE88_11620 [Rhodobacteraceae bacterium]|nr:hypothetical protein [Paracoccaceae bacterium]